ALRPGGPILVSMRLRPIPRTRLRRVSSAARSAARPASILRLILCRAALATAIGLAVGALPSVALADPTLEEKDRARALMDDGDRAFDAGDYPTALRDYEAAHAIMAVPTTGLWLAKTQAALGKLVEARDTAVAVTRMPQKVGEHRVMQEA